MKKDNNSFKDRSNVHKNVLIFKGNSANIQGFGEFPIKM